MAGGFEADGLSPLGALPEGESFATFEPYAGVFDNPDLDLIYLAEIEHRPAQP